MKFNLCAKELKTINSDCIVIGVHESSKLTLQAEKLDQTSNGEIKKILQHGDFQGKIGQSQFLYDISGIKKTKVLLVGCGKKDQITVRDYKKIISSTVEKISSSKVKSVLFCLTDLNIKNFSLPMIIKQTIQITADCTYNFDHFKSKKTTKSKLENISIYIDTKELTKELGKECEKALDEALATISGMELTKNLANTPSNICTPSYLANEAKKLAKEYKSIKVKVLDETQMKKLGMNALLAVSKGSFEPAKLICIEYKGKDNKKPPVALIGKGITFDTGGISLKPAGSMTGMKYDMCGAATVLGTLKSAAEMKLPGNIIGIIASAENMPSGTACKPEDIVTTMSGQTVEIMNTDAEGRLVLCDALTYCERYKPEIVIDIATLTGAVVVALGYHATGMLSNDETLAKKLTDAGTKSHDRVWELPLWDEYQDQLTSPFADMSNIGGRDAGTITAACFLSKFANKFKWAHLDVAGTAAMMGVNNRFATGRPVPLLTEYLINHTNKK
ncbi:leucyl aminopeptidase [Gammaproteobacteria bacterium]|nr:leucyl aminopeptidase [Gammaproteobacteria bacterium]